MRLVFTAGIISFLSVQGVGGDLEDFYARGVTLISDQEYSCSGNNGPPEGAYLKAVKEAYQIEVVGERHCDYVLKKPIVLRNTNKKVATLLLEFRPNNPQTLCDCKYKTVIKVDRSRIFKGMTIYIGSEKEIIKHFEIKE